MNTENSKLTPAQRSLRARIAINTRLAQPDYDAHEATRAATSATVSITYVRNATPS